MKLINAILRGIVIGVANIIPGVSGGTMMVSMGIYDELIYSITHLFKDFKKSVLTLLPYFIGMAIGIVGLASLLKWLFANWPLPTYTCFIGLILGGLKPLLRKIEVKKINAVAVIAFLVLFALVICMGVFGPEKSAHVSDGGAYEPSFPLTLPRELLLVVMGMLASATMIIPGVSGSMLMMLLGIYQDLLGAVSGLKDALFAMNFPAMVKPVLVLLPFGIGVLLGIFGVAKLIELLTERAPTPTYMGVLGLVLASPLAILLKQDYSGVTPGIIILSVVTLIAGFAAAMALSRGSEKAQAAAEASVPEAEE